MSLSISPVVLTGKEIQMLRRSTQHRDRYSKANQENLLPEVIGYLKRSRIIDFFLYYTLLQTNAGNHDSLRAPPIC